MVKLKNKYVRWIVVITLALLCNPITVLILFLYGASQGM